MYGVKLSNSAAQVSTRLKTAVTPSSLRRGADVERLDVPARAPAWNRKGRRAWRSSICSRVTVSSDERGHLLFEVDLFADLAQEPGIDGGEGVDLLFGVAVFEGVADVAQAVGIGRNQARLDQLFVEFRGAVGFAGFRLRMPLPSACLKVRPMAITSPTLFICVPSTGSAPGNFSNCQRGILTTT